MQQILYSPCCEQHTDESISRFGGHISIIWSDRATVHDGNIPVFLIVDFDGNTLYVAFGFVESVFVTVVQHGVFG